mmetsp:Transcript_122331/g.346863  ORF Transcript_122331/g.346863 Transcript_122331/m.346863 type:complete len:251 (+) Transcript_122331:400-1152(+)
MGLHPLLHFGLVLLRGLRVGDARGRVQVHPGVRRGHPRPLPVARPGDPRQVRAGVKAHVVLQPWFRHVLRQQLLPEGLAAEEQLPRAQAAAARLGKGHVGHVDVMAIQLVQVLPQSCERARIEGFEAAPLQPAVQVPRDRGVEHGDRGDAHGVELLQCVLRGLLGPAGLCALEHLIERRLVLAGPGALLRVWHGAGRGRRRLPARLPPLLAGTCRFLCSRRAAAEELCDRGSIVRLHRVRRRRRSHCKCR